MVFLTYNVIMPLLRWCQTTKPSVIGATWNHQFLTIKVCFMNYIIICIMSWTEPSNQIKSKISKNCDCPSCIVGKNWFNWNSKLGKSVGCRCHDYLISIEQTQETNKKHLFLLQRMHRIIRLGMLWSLNSRNELLEQ